MTFVVCQSQNQDSLIRLIRPNVCDTSQIQLLNVVAQGYMETNAEKGLMYANDAIRRAGKIHDQAGLSNASNIKGVCYDVIGNYDSALFYYKQALRTSPVKSDDPLLAGIYSNIGLVYWNIDQYPQALSYFHTARKLVEKSKNTRFLAIILSNTGLIYHDIKDYPQSNIYFQKAIAIYQADKDTIGSIGSIINLAINYFETRKYDACEALFEQYASYIDRMDEYTKSEFLVNKATLEINTRLKTTTEKDLTEALRLKRQIGHSLGVAYVLIQFSEYYHLKGDIQQSIHYCYQALSLTEELKSLKKLGPVYDNLFLNYSMLHEKDSARKYRELYTAVIDTMFAEARAKAISREQVAFKTLEKEKENLELLHENSIIRFRNQLIIVCSLSLLCLLVLSFWFVSRIRKQRARLKQKEIADQIVFETEQLERERIARDLHDSVGQKLAVVKMKLSMNQPGKDSTVELLDQAIADVRTASHNLLPEDLRRGLVSAVEEIIDQINYAKIGIKAELSAPLELRQRTLPKQTELYLYRIIQEIINNALKYAKASNIHINMELGVKKLNVVLSDDGVGMPNQESEMKGIGLKNIKARIGQLKGTVDIVSKAGKGTRFIIDVPL